MHYNKLEYFLVILFDTLVNLFSVTSPYHKLVSAVTSKRRRSSRSGLPKIKDLPVQEDKRSISKINKKRSS